MPTTEVLLVEHIANLGAEGDVVDVSRHYLPFECQRLGIMRR